MARMWSLAIRSFVGISFGASHYMPEISGPDRCIRVQWVPKSVDDLRSVSTPDFRWKSNWPTDHFASREDALAAALVVWESIKEPGDAIGRPHFNRPSDWIAGEEQDRLELIKIRDFSDSDWDEDSWKLVSAWLKRFEDYDYTMPDTEEIDLVRDGDGWKIITEAELGEMDGPDEEFEKES